MRSTLTSAPLTCTSADCARRWCALGVRTRSVQCAAPATASRRGREIPPVHRQLPRVLVVQGKVSVGGAMCGILKKVALHALTVPRCKDAEELLRGKNIDAILIERTSLDQCP